MIVLQTAARQWIATMNEGFQPRRLGKRGLITANQGKYANLNSFRRRGLHNGGVAAHRQTAAVIGCDDLVGMMHEARQAGQRLPGRPGLTKMRKAKQHAVARAPGLHIHPCTVIRCHSIAMS